MPASASSLRYAPPTATNARCSPCRSYPYSLAGAVLAAEAVKELAHWPPLSASVPRAVFQFLNPLAESNGASSYQRQRDCPQSGDTSPGGAVWRKRAQAANSRPDEGWHAPTSPTNMAKGDE